MSTPRFALICTGAALLLFVLSALGLGIIAFAVLAGVGAILKAHRRLYFQHLRKGAFAYTAYVFSVVMMVWTTISLVPRIDLLTPHGVRPPDPVPAAYWIHFALGSIFLLTAWRPKDPNALPLAFTGSVLREQGCILAQAPRVAWESLRASITLVTEAHWLKGLGGLILLVLSVPVSVIALAAGALAVCWFAVLWAGFSALLVIPLWILHKLLFRAGIPRTCPGCSQQHLISGPGPMGFFRIRCRCGQAMGMWSRDGAFSSDRSQELPPWRQLPRQPGTLPLMVMGITLAVLMALRACRCWEGPILRVP